MLKNFKEIVQELETFCTEHNQINSFAWGNIDNISTTDQVYPQLFLMPVPSTLESTMANITFDMYVMDVMKQDRSNLLDVMNETLLIGSDVVANYFDNEEDYNMTLDESVINIQPFEFRFDDVLAGWIFTITLQVENNLNDCAIPKNLT